jgi:hypothetical protein
VLLDLIRALPAAVLVGVLPGWFWARCLCATRDRAERLAYSVGFSITLVPTLGLVQARLFGTGITFPITVVSVVLVLGTGLAAYLRFTSAKGFEAPPAARLTPLELPTLVPLVGAAALVLGNLIGTVPRYWVMPLAALLAFSAGAARLLGSDHTSQPFRPPVGSAQVWRAVLSGPSILPVARWILLSVVLALVLLRGYSGPMLHDWPFPRGVDRFGHAVMTAMMLSDGSTESFMLYPPGFHVLAAQLSRLSGLEPMELFAVLAPALLALPALGCYVLGSRLWGWPCGVAAAAFCGLLLGGAYEHVGHARYANLIAAQFLLVLAVGALVRLYASSSTRDGLTFAVLGSSVVFYHQVASLYEALLLGLVALLFLPYLLWRERGRGLALLSSLSLLGLLSVLYAWDTYDLGRLAAGLVGGARTGKGGEAVAMALGTKPPMPWDHLLEITPQPVLWLGLLGALLLLTDPGSRAGTPDALARVTLLAWTLLLYIGGRTAISSFPDRFERDLAIPLALLAALAFLAILQALVASRSITSLVALLALALVLTALGIQLVRNMEDAAGPSDRAQDRAPAPGVAAVGSWLREHNNGGNILSTPYIGETSARGILAMGGYSAMQSYTMNRIQRARDLPPFGVGPLRDAQWALHHPGDERTARILANNDVRYVVLYKRYPGIEWRSFRARMDLYRLVYENNEAAVFAPRET